MPVFVLKTMKINSNTKLFHSALSQYPNYSFHQVET